MAKCAQQCRSPGWAPAYHLESSEKSEKSEVSGFLACTTSRRPLGSEKNHFFKWLFTKMAVSVVGGWESGYELAGRPLVLKNAWICFRTSFSWVGNNPSVQIHLFCKNWGKCHWTCDSSYGLFSAVLMRCDLHVADPSYLQCNEAN